MVLERLLCATRRFYRRSRVPADPGSVTDIGAEVPPARSGIDRDRVEGIWRRAVDLYRTGLHPALQLCIRHRGVVVLDRAIGHRRGNGPGAASPERAEPVTTATPFTVFSASKSVTALLVHRLEEQRRLHLDDRVCEYIPEFSSHGKDRTTIRHLLTHRAGIPDMPEGALRRVDPGAPDEMVGLISLLRPRYPPGDRVAYHGATTGFLLGEIVRRVTGKDLRTILARDLRRPLGLKWLDFGVRARDVGAVAENALTGFPVLPPLSGLFRRVLGIDYDELVDLSNQPAFLTGILPSLNLVSTARELATLYQCLLDEGEFAGRRILSPRTVRRLVAEQTGLEFDRTARVPLRYSTGMILGGRHISLFGPATPRAFGHNGFTNIFTWADADRDIAVALLTSGKPLLSPHLVALARLMFGIAHAFGPAQQREPLRSKRIRVA